MDEITAILNLVAALIAVVIPFVVWLFKKI